MLDLAYHVDTTFLLILKVCDGVEESLKEVNYQMNRDWTP